MESNTSLRQLGRFSEPGYLILISLADGPKHGYAMLEDIEAWQLSASAPAHCTAPWPASSDSV